MIVRLSQLRNDEIIQLYYQLLRRLTLFKENLVATEDRRRAFDLCRNVDETDAPHLAITLELEGLLWTGDRTLKEGLQAKGFTRFFEPQGENAEYPALRDGQRGKLVRTSHPESHLDAGHGARRAGRFQARDLFLGQTRVHGREGCLKVLRRGSADDRSDDGGLVEQPGPRDPGGRLSASPSTRSRQVFGTKLMQPRQRRDTLSPVRPSRT